MSAAAAAAAAAETKKVLARDLPTGAHIVYVTDAEGNLGYLRRVLSHSDGVTVQASPARILLSEDTFLVFGGDVVDKVRSRPHD
jgi:hypothetical protein